MGRAFIAGGVCLVLGMVVGVLAGLALGTAPQRESIIVRTATIVMPIAPASAQEPTKRARASDAPKPAGIAGRAEDLLAQILATPLASAPPAGTGVIKVVVTRADGTPVADLPFVLTAEFPASADFTRTQAYRTDILPLEERMAIQLQRERWTDATRQVKRSGADGRIAFEGLSDVLYSVQAYVEGWQIIPTDFQAGWRCRPGKELTFTATRMGGIRVSVLNPDGTAPPQATVWLSNATGGSGGNAWTPGAATVWTAPGRYRIWAQAGAFQESKSDQADIEVPADGAPVECAIQLKSSAGFGGVVRIPAEHWGAQPYCEMGTVRIDGSDFPSADTFHRDGKQTPTGSYSGFAYSFTDLTPGRYAVALTLNGCQEPVGTWTIDVGASFVSRDFELGPPDRSRFLEVIVLDPEGSPVRGGVQCGMSARSKNRSQSGGGFTITRPNGTVWALQPDLLPEADTKYSVRVTHGDYGTRVAEFRPGPNAAVEVRYTWPAFVDVTVDGWAAQPAKSAFQFVVRPTAETRGRMDQYLVAPASGESPDGSGRIRFGPIAPGDYEVTVNIKSDFGSRGVQNTAVTLAPGSNAATVTLPELCAVTVELGAERAGKRISCAAASASGRHGDVVGTYQADKNGRVNVTRLVAGNYILTLDGERETRLVKVPETASVVW